VVPRKDPEALAGALNLLLSPLAGGLRSAYGEAARRRAVTHFSRAAMAEGVLRVYGGVLAKEADHVRALAG
jgi:glycosyltransferase involved in cell wall biosynthesis